MVVVVVVVVAAAVAADESWRRNSYPLDHGRSWPLAAASRRRVFWRDSPIASRRRRRAGGKADAADCRDGRCIVAVVVDVDVVVVVESMAALPWSWDGKWRGGLGDYKGSGGAVARRSLFRRCGASWKKEKEI